MVTSVHAAVLDFLRDKLNSSWSQIHEIFYSIKNMRMISYFSVPFSSNFLFFPTVSGQFNASEIFIKLASRAAVQWIP